MDASTHEFEVSGKRYRARPLNARAQFHITRRLAPVLSSLKDLIGGGDAIVAMAANKVDTPPSDDPQTVAAAVAQASSAQAAAVIGAASPFLDAIAKMSDEDVDYIIDRCLEVTYRLDERGAAQSMWNAAARRPMFEDLQMTEMLAIVWSVIQGSSSLMGFSSGLLSPSQAA